MGQARKGENGLLGAIRRVFQPGRPSRSEVSCTHLDQIQDVTPSAEGCEECLKTGDQWVHLRICLICGHVGCCDNSRNTHATKHFQATGHPLMQSIEPGENWIWCYVDKVAMQPEES